MSEENLRVIRAAFDALSRRDMPAMLELADPSVVFTRGSPSINGTDGFRSP